MSTSSFHPTGLPSLDTFLQGGWLAGALTELTGENGAGKTTLALAAAAHATRNRNWVALFSRGSTLFPPAFHAAGVELHHLLWVRPQDEEPCRWALEQVTRSGLFPLLIAHEIFLPDAGARRLQLAAEKSGVTVLVVNSRPLQAWAVSSRFRVTRISDRVLAVNVLKSRVHLSRTSLEVSLDGKQTRSPLLSDTLERRVAS